jgi:hypothetical protein
VQVAYSAASQAAGECQKVARIIHTAFTRLGQTPQYLAFKANQREEYMVFELASGRDASVSRNGYHVAVRLGELIYDAYTGPLGMKLSDYHYCVRAKQAVGEGGASSLGFRSNAREPTGAARKRLSGRLAGKVEWRMLLGR